LNAFRIGADLKAGRLRLGLSVEELAARTRIPARFLQALENNDLSVFPGIVFARNFTRQYATALGLDPAPLLEAMPRLEQDSVRLPDPPAHPRARRTRLKSRFWPSLAWGLVAACGLAAAWVYHEQAWKRVDWSLLRPGTSTVAADLNRTSSGVSQIPALPGADAGSAVGPIPGESHDPLPATGPGPDSGGTPVAASAGAPPLAERSQPVQVVVTALEAAWVRLSADDRSAFVGILKPHEARTVSAAGSVKVLTGNAGGIEISLNGKAIDPIGPRGQVRTVRLTAEGPELLTKVPETTGSVQESPL